MRTALVGMLLMGWIGPAFAQAAEPAPTPPPSPPVVREPSAEAAPARASTQAEPSRAQIQEILEAARATAKATRENVDYSRVVPDLLTQILAKLDKIEDKLDRIDEHRISGTRRR